MTRTPPNADVLCMNRIIGLRNRILALRKLVGKYDREGSYQKRNTAQRSLDEARTELNNRRREMGVWYVCIPNHFSFFTQITNPKTTNSHPRDNMPGVCHMLSQAKLKAVGFLWAGYVIVCCRSLCVRRRPCRFHRREPRLQSWRPSSDLHLQVYVHVCM